MTSSQDAELAKADHPRAIQAARYQLTEPGDIELCIAADTKLFRRSATQRKTGTAKFFYFAPILMNRLRGLTDPPPEKKHTHRWIA